MAIDIYATQVKTIDGVETDLNDFRGKVLMIVNVASKCGLTPQYEGLESVYEKYRSNGFEVLGFPANNFLSQEPGSEEEIRSFCSTNYGVQFPLFSKISVKGENKHLLYKKLTAAHSTADINNGPDFEEKLAGFGQKRDVPEDILWNFEKFIIGKDGNVIARVAPDVPADDPRVVSKIESALSA
jgi:glutathione peroxidase